jgi:multidrug efflux pump subunit AcrB
MLMSNLLAGAAVILAAVFVIMGLRPAVIVALALPLVVALVILGWHVTGGAIHQMSIFGLIIALGLLIDNAIVVTDEITSAKAKGLNALDAVRYGVRHRRTAAPCWSAGSRCTPRSPRSSPKQERRKPSSCSRSPNLRAFSGAVRGF